jgi:hypothetical protein
MVRDWVFGDSKETWFSADEFTIAYCEWNEWRLDTAEDEDGHCEDDEDQDSARTILGPTGMMEYDETVLSKILPLSHNGTDKRTQGVKPRPPPRSGLPPPFNAAMLA